MKTNPIRSPGIALTCAVSLTISFFSFGATAGPPATAEFLIRPVPPKVGVYPQGTTIVGDELRAPYGGFRAWFDVYVRNWDPDQDDSPALKFAVAKTGADSWLGANAVPANPGMDLTNPYITCTSDSDCETEFGEPGSFCYDTGPEQRCYGTYQSTNRSNWFCANGACFNWRCDEGYYYNIRCFVVAEGNGPSGSFHDDGTEKYLATQVLDVPLGAAGRYTVGFYNVDETFLEDPDGNRIPVAARLPAHLVIDGGNWECYPPDSLDMPKNRAISLNNPAPGSATPTALRVTLVDLQNPVPPNADGNPPPDFSAYEHGPTCTDLGGCRRWVGEPAPFHECSPGAHGGLLRIARLQCTPYYYDWSTLGLFHVMGAEIIPSSTYDVEVFPDTCMGSEPTCPNVSQPIRLFTSRHGDVIPPFGAPDGSTQPDGSDVVAIVDKFKCMCASSTKAQMQLGLNLPEAHLDLTGSDVVSAVDAFKSFAYRNSGPCPCPSEVPCNVTPCAGPSDCTPIHGAGAMCVRTCVGGYNDGDACLYDEHCSGGTCGDGYCRDRCGRCLMPPTK